MASAQRYEGPALQAQDVQLQQKELELARATNKEVDKELSSLNKKQQRQKFRAGRKDRITQSALIGGGFPFLFGGGPLQALAGGLGGGIGESISPGGGFAGSIAATAAFSSIQKAVDGIAKLGQAMNPLTMDIQALTQSIGLAGTPAEKYLKVLEQTQGKQAAFNESMKRMRGIIGEEGVRELQKFGETMRSLTNNLAEFFTKLSAGFAKVFNKFGQDPGSALGRVNILSRAEKSRGNKGGIKYDRQSSFFRSEKARGSRRLDSETSCNYPRTNDFCKRRRNPGGESSTNNLRKGRGTCSYFYSHLCREKENSSFFSPRE